MLVGQMISDYDLQAVPLGFYLMPLTEYGSMITGLDTTQLNADLHLDFDATYITGSPGVNVIKVMREAVRPIRLK
jgi:hypothetical protein